MCFFFVFFSCFLQTGEAIEGSRQNDNGRADRIAANDNVDCDVSDGERVGTVGRDSRGLRW